MEATVALMRVPAWRREEAGGHGDGSDISGHVSFIRPDPETLQGVEDAHLVY